MSGKGRIKLLEARAKSILDQVKTLYDSSKNVSEANEQLFITKAKHVLDIRKEFLDRITELEELKVDADEKNEYQPSFKVIETVDDYIDNIVTVMNRLVEKIESRKPPPPQPTLPTTPAAPVVNSGIKIKLEPLKIPDFDGSVGNWLPFYQTFKRLVHENEQFNDMQRVAYLTSHLVGSAKSITKGISPTEENYQILLDTLVERFQDVRSLGNYYLDQIMDFKPLSSESEGNLNRFLENFVEPVLAFKTFEEIEDPFDFFLVYLAGKKLDPATIRHFDMANRGTNLPSFDDLKDFVREQARILARNKRSSTGNQPSNNSRKSTHALLAQQPETASPNDSPPATKACKFCKASPHQLYACEKFKTVTPRERFAFVKSHYRCYNCLSDQHRSIKCKSTSTCGACKRRHHTLLHLGDASASPGASPSSPAQASTTPSVGSPGLPVGTTTAMSGFCGHTLVLLSTAQVMVQRDSGDQVTLRALLDGGSQSHFICRRSCEILGLTTRPVRSIVKGLGNGSTSVQEEASLTFYSRTKPGVSYTINALVMEELTERMPSMPVRLDLLPHIASLPLADQEFHIPGNVDLLIGAALWPQIVGSQKIEGPPCTPAALESSLGWLIMGTMPVCVPSFVTSSCHAIVKEEDPLKKLLERFWEIEEVPEPSAKKPEDIECEKIFCNSTVRQSDGRYMVALPFADPPSLLGNSLEQATKQFLSLESRFTRSPEFHAQYMSVMNSYLDMEYMSEVPNQELESSEPCFYLPHHGVVKPGSTSTPLRIVLNASAKSSSGYSLNDILHTGEKLQADIVRILLNFRLFETTLSADIRQMYLRVLVRPTDRRFQRLIWRNSPNEAIKIYQMNTVVFGMASSPFLAQRCVKQLLEDDGAPYPHAATIAARDLYMDDLLCSLPSDQEACQAQKELSQLFVAGSFTLTKWCSNSELVMSQIPLNNPQNTAPLIPHSL